MASDAAIWCPYIHVAGADVRAQPWRSPDRLLTHWLAVVSADGGETVVIDGRIYDIPSGGAYLVQPGSHADLRSPHGSSPVWVHFDLAWDPRRSDHPQVHTYTPELGPRGAWMQPRAAALFGFDLPVVVPGPVLPAFRNGLRAVVDDWRRGGPLRTRRAAANLGLLLLGMAEQAGGTGGGGAITAEERILRAEEAARAGLASGAGLAEMAAAAGLARSRFCALYARVRGGSPGGFLRNERLRRAQELLARPELPVAEIATQVGYADATVFGRAFRAATGRTPGAWRTANTG